MKDIIMQLPKAELHVHIEGTMEPEQYLTFAERNKVKIPYNTLEQARQAYEFTDYHSFITAYLAATQVLCTEQDFYDLTIAYLQKMRQQGVLHVEVFFELQSYIVRNIAPAVIINGIYEALQYGAITLGISGLMIMSFLRHLSEQEAFNALKLSLPYKDKIVGVGLAAYEQGNPPSKFQHVFKQAHDYGYHIVVHAEIGNGDYLHQAIDLLHAERIDHGIPCLQNPELVNEIKRRNIALTVCPISNVMLGLYPSLLQHPIKKMIEWGLPVTINSDDPSFFKHYIADNYYAVHETLGVTFAELVFCAHNSFLYSFANDARKKECIAILNAYLALLK
jgi:adenosine deaminase